MKRASAVKADEEDDDMDDSDLEESGTGAVSALAGIFKNVRAVWDEGIAGFLHGCKNRQRARVRD